MSDEPNITRMDPHAECIARMSKEMQEVVDVGRCESLHMVLVANDGEVYRWRALHDDADVFAAIGALRVSAASLEKMCLDGEETVDKT